MNNTMIMEGYKMPIPYLEEEELEFGTEFWRFSLEGVSRYIWENTPGNRILLDYGFCFRSFEDAATGFLNATIATRRSMNFIRTAIKEIK